MQNLLTYGRTIDLKHNNIWKKQKWVDNDPFRQVVSPNYHWGQLKLFYTELEFLTIANQSYDLSKTVCIYIGAGPGTHIRYLRELFPMLHWILIDPVKFHIYENEYISIWTGNKGFFSDSLIPELLSHPFVQNNKYKLFISDIRTNPIESVIFQEMLDQQRWLLKLDADLSMLKFRLPYTLQGQKSVWEYDTSDIHNYVRNVKSCKKNKPYNVCYLDGDVYIQLFPPQFSTETRLIVDKSKTKFKMRNYNTVDYEEKCLYYNVHIRQQPMKYEHSIQLEHHILGCRNTYEIASEYFIVESYLKSMNKKYDLANICRFIYNIRNFHNDNISTAIGSFKFNKSLVTVQLFTIYKEKMINLDMLRKLINKKQISDPEKIKKLLNSITELYIDSNNYISKQIEFITHRKTNILTDTEYSKQIQILNESITINQYIYDTLSHLFSRL